MSCSDELESTKRFELIASERSSVSHMISLKRLRPKLERVLAEAIAEGRGNSEAASGMTTTNKRNLKKLAKTESKIDYHSASAAANN